MFSLLHVDSTLVQSAQDSCHWCGQQEAQRVLWRGGELGCASGEVSGMGTQGNGEEGFGGRGQFQTSEPMSPAAS